MKKVALVVLGLLLIGGMYVIGNRNGSISITVSHQEVMTPTPTPFPFAELTIPYLQKKAYEGVLGERTLVGKYGAYDSYLTSYQSDDFKINGLLTIPTTEKPPGGFPGIVLIHGYIPPSQYQTLEKYEAYVDYLAQSGFVVFKIDLRGHGESEGTAGGAYYSSGYIVDTLNAYNALSKSDFVDLKRIGLWGHSMGGNVVMRSAVVQKNIPAVVIWAGAVYTYEDFQTYRINDASYVPPATGTPRAQSRQRLFDAVGEFSSNHPFWSQVVPTNYLAGIPTQFQIHHAINDEVVSIEYSRNVVQVAKTKGITIDLVEHQSGGHNISDPAFSEAMRQTVAFFTQHLQ